jgi:AcrR family transcriptional regulator
MPRSKTSVVAAPDAAPVKPGRGKADSRAKILRAAEQLFGEQGFEGCSLREVADLAQVNQGMIHYFFKSKETLFTEAYMASGRLLVDERLQLLDAEEAASRGNPVPLERLIEIFLKPAVKIAMRGTSGRNFLRMQARLQLDQSRFGSRLRSGLYDESSRRFVEAFARALPQLTREQVSWRFVFMLGTYQYVLANTGRLEVISGGTCSGKDYSEALRQMIPFVAAGMSASSPP